MFFTDNSPLLHWIFSFITYYWVSSENCASLCPLPPPHFSFLHPFPRAVMNMLDSTDSAQPSFQESSPTWLLPMPELTFYCYLCFLCLNQVIIQTGGVVLMQPQLSFHKSLSMCLFFPSNTSNGSLRTGSNEAWWRGHHWVVLQNSASDADQQQMFQEGDAWDLSVCINSAWCTNSRCCNYFTSRQDASEGGSGKGDGTLKLKNTTQKLDPKR